MMRAAKRLLYASLLLTTACEGTTGQPLVSFGVAVAGPIDADGTSLRFDNHFGYHVTLSRARLRVGAVYLNQSLPTSGGQETGCVLPGTYVGEAWGPATIDVLSAKPQLLSEAAIGIRAPARAAEIWLYGRAPEAGHINDDDDSVILDASGTAEKAGVRYAFDAQLRIGKNRVIASRDPTKPSANPICKQRIVSPVPVRITPSDDGTLLVRVDPKRWFNAVDFAALPEAADHPGRYVFADAPTNTADINLYAAMRSRTAFEFSWLPASAAGAAP